MQDKAVQATYDSYFRFNNERTLSTDCPSQLSITETDDCTIYVDKTRQYDNQIIIRDTCDTARLEKYLQLFKHSFSPEISIEPQADSDELRAWLSSRGFAPIFEQEFLELRADHYLAAKETAESISIERWEATQADGFLALLKTSGLECTDDIWQKRRALYCTDSFRCFVAKIEGKPCAWATSFIDNEYAILANAYTQESYRSNGCQTALLRTRIEDAIGLGVRVLLTDVMPNSTSSNNCKAVGFSSAGIRTVWGKE